MAHIISKIDNIILKLTIIILSIIIMDKVQYVTKYCGTILRDIAFNGDGDPKPRHGVDLHRILAIMFRPTVNGMIPTKYGWFFDNDVGMFGLIYAFDDGCLAKFSFIIPGGYSDGTTWYYHKMIIEHDLDRLRDDIQWYYYKRACKK